ncbi:uncharacterized protein CC84DRAFT_1204611 [Paraphaeosphaeria sporulosa]|uniref:Uncharacterized protein n=1 Tax=Paraphaeosphaeria sporulosa TaxID=1460663 RepID=A0A177CHC0_9PLEO|nr:uncharacterized protein CC84DRAFT_1204611 [Paraphaeosphaeria sporulosa]OAG06973.1 hypothetical protein CC84DRAFT_1204611 [Paraphaeosphaeria sporulosa]
MRLSFLPCFILLASTTPQPYAMSFIPKSAKNVTRVAVGAKDWVVNNPKTAAGVAAAPVVGVVAAPLALGVAGFTAGGVAAGSMAAGIQAGIGNVAAGSIFAGLMSAGAGGAALAVVQGIAGGAAAAVAGGTAYVMKKGKVQDEDIRNSEGGKGNGKGPAAKL